MSDYKKDLDKVTTAIEARKAFNQAPWESEAQKAIYIRWNELSLQEIKQATTLGEAQRAWFNSPDGSEAEQAGLKKICKLSKK